MPRPSMITFNGESRTIADWSQLTGISPSCIRKRLECGWNVERTLSTKVGPQGRPRKPKPAPQSIFEMVPALQAYQRDMHAAHRQMTRSIRAFVRGIEAQMAALRYQLEKELQAQKDQAGSAVMATQTPRVGQSDHQSANDRSPSSAQEIR